METVPELFLAAVDRYPERVFLRPFGARPVSYREAARRVAATAQALLDAGLGLGDRLVCYTEELVPALFVQLACAHTGVVPLHLPPRFAVDSMLALCRRIDARGLFTTASVAAPSLPLVDSAWSGADAEARALLERLAASRRSSDVYQIQPTSGTTGQFNLVVRTHDPIVHTGWCYVDACGFRAADDPPLRVLFSQPLTHGPGNYSLCMVLRLAAEGVIPSELDAKARLAEVRELDPAFGALPFRVWRSLYDQYVAQGAQGKWWSPSAAVLICGASAPDLEVLRAARAHGIDVMEHYGMVETGSLVLTERGAWREGWMGKVLPDVELRSAPDGELLARTPRMMLGYLDDRELTASEHTADGFFHTRDYCEITPDGYVRYLGRKKDRFNTLDGSNIHPGHIEQRLELLDWCKQVVLVGDRRPYVVALIVVDDATPIGELYERARNDIARINAQLETIEQVRRFALLDRPMSAELYKLAGQGKIGRNRQAIEAAYRDEIERLYADDAPDLCRVSG
jgi:long-subunit acyl-CoA synthetase (AMP-forming)